MSHHHEIANRLFAALSAGDIPDELLADDMQAWTVSSQTWLPRERYQAGARLLAAVFDGPYRYTVESLTAEDNRVAAEVKGEGMLVTGEAFANEYLFLLHIRDGKIATLREFFDVRPVQEQLVPLLQEAMGKAQNN